MRIIMVSIPVGDDGIPCPLICGFALKGTQLIQCSRRMKMKHVQTMHVIQNLEGHIKLSGPISQISQVIFLLFLFAMMYYLYTKISVLKKH